MLGHAQHGAPTWRPAKVVRCTLCMCCNTVNLSVPEEVDAELTRELLQKYDLQAAGSLVRLPCQSCPSHVQAL